MRRGSIGVALLTVALTASGPYAASAAEPDEIVCLLSPLVDSVRPIVGTVVGGLGAATAVEPICVDLTINDMGVSFDEESGRVATGGPRLAAALGLGPERDTFTLGFDYKNAEYTGNPRLRWVTEDYQRCNGNSERVFSARSMPKGWKDVVGSAHGHQASGCFTFRHYEDAGFQGARVDCYSCYSMGALDDHTSSIAFW